MLIHIKLLHIYPLVNCTALECDSPPPVQNSNVSTNGVIVSSIAKYSCNDGYMLVGNDSLICTEGEHESFWKGTIPSCIKNGMKLHFAACTIEWLTINQTLHIPINHQL